MSQNKMQNKDILLDELRKRRDRLEIKKAKQGVNADPSLDNEIEDIDNKIDEIEKSSEDTGGYQLTILPHILEKYDIFFDRFAKCMPSYENDPIKFRKNLLAALRCALDADYVFIAFDTKAKWKIVEYDSKLETKTPDSILDSDIEQLISRSVKQHHDNLKADPRKYPGITMGNRLGKDPIILAPFPDSLPVEVLVLYGVKMELRLDSGIALILDSLIHITKNFINPRSSSSILIKLFNALKRNFLYVSDSMYNRLFKLFQEQLNDVVMYYEPIVSLSHYPYICRWEALARNLKTEKAPKDLFETCELWGRRFQTELDIYCLNLAVKNYRERPNRPDKNNERIIQKSSKPNTYKSRVGDILPLSVNVYPETLIRPAYRDAIVNLAKSKLIPSDKLTLEISEKRPIPKPEEPLLEQDEMTWFRDRLNYYTELGITFAIDDYGVGFASASRLSRLEPAIVKIDRDALLHSRGSYTIKQVLELGRESMGKMIVVIEGFDDESKLSLAELYEKGVRYVQGHATIGGMHKGIPVPPEEIYRLNEADEENMVKRLGLL